VLKLLNIEDSPLISTVVTVASSSPSISKLTPFFLGGDALGTTLSGLSFSLEEI